MMLPETERQGFGLRAFEKITGQRHASESIIAQRRLLDQALSYNTSLQDYMAQYELSRYPNGDVSQGLDVPLLWPMREAEAELTSDVGCRSFGDTPEISDVIARPAGLLESLKGLSHNLVGDSQLLQRPSPSAAPPLLASEPSSAGSLASSWASLGSVSAKRTWLTQVSARKTGEEFYDTQNVADNTEAKDQESGIWSARVLRLQRESARKSVSEFYEAQNVEEEDVEAMYKESGIWIDIARAAWFKKLTMAVTFLSIIWIAVDTDYNKAAIIFDAPPLFQVVDNGVCVFFLIELTVRFMAFQEKADAFRNSSFVFDGFLVLLTVWDLWIQALIVILLEDGSTSRGASANMSSVFRIFRIARLARVLRMSRIFRSIPELFILVKGMVKALRSVAITLALLLVMTYSFAIFFTQTLSTSAVGEHHFVSVPTSMNFLLLQVVCGFDIDFITSLYDAGSWGSYFAMLLFLLLGSLTIMNMLVGVLVDVVARTADKEHETQALDTLRSQLVDLVALTDQDGTNTVDQREFLEMLSNPEAMQLLDDVGVNVRHLLDYAALVFRDQDEMSLNQFVDTVVQFRGQNSVNVQDLMNLRLFVSQEMERLQLKMRDRLEPMDAAQGITQGAQLSPTVEGRSPERSVRQTSPPMQKLNVTVPHRRASVRF